jgi:hypothetical protein
MAHRITLGIVLCLFSSVASAHPRSSRKNSPAAIDPVYCSALAAANRFLHAWQIQDHETGIMMLSDSARRQTSSEVLEEFFSPSPQAAYEIAHGRKMSETEYIFPAVLFGESKHPTTAYTGKIVLVRSGKEDWVVTRLP